MRQSNSVLTWKSTNYTFFEHNFKALPNKKVIAVLVASLLLGGALTLAGTYLMIDGGLIHLAPLISGTGLTLGGATFVITVIGRGILEKKTTPNSHPILPKEQPPPLKQTDFEKIREQVQLEIQRKETARNTLLDLIRTKVLGSPIDAWKEVIRSLEKGLLSQATAADIYLFLDCLVYYESQLTREDELLYSSKGKIRQAINHCIENHPQATAEFFTTIDNLTDYESEITSLWIELDDLTQQDQMNHIPLFMEILEQRSKT